MGHVKQQTVELPERKITFIDSRERVQGNHLFDIKYTQVGTNCAMSSHLSPHMYFEGQNRGGEHGYAFSFCCSTTSHMLDGQIT